jgi:hypothetical protein
MVPAESRAKSKLCPRDGLSTTLARSPLLGSVVLVDNASHVYPRWYLCPEHHERHAETRRFLCMDGEALDKTGAPSSYNLLRMSQFQLWAQPWWVNLLILIPLAAIFSFQRTGRLLGGRHLVLLTLFATAFGFVEASVVVYLRAAAGLLPGYTGSLADVQRSPEIYQQGQSISQLPQSLVTIEVYRETATMIMLVTVVLLAAGTTRERWAAFLWVFAFWDIFYYVGLWATVRWPTSLKDVDVLFLIPVPWIAQVWFPVLVSLLTLLVIALCRREQVH